MPNAVQQIKPRRQTNKLLAGLGLAASMDIWIRPLLKTTILPAHAQATTPPTPPPPPATPTPPPPPTVFTLPGFVSVNCASNTTVRSVRVDDSVSPPLLITSTTASAAQLVRYTVVENPLGRAILEVFVGSSTARVTGDLSCDLPASISIDPSGSYSFNFTAQSGAVWKATFSASVDLGVPAMSLSDLTLSKV